MGPKKQKQGGSAAKNKTTTVPDSEHIVFGNDKSGSKSKTDVKDDALAPPRPDARKIVGGASWTGKLPVNLLSEHCQRQKWNKPDYSMRQMPNPGNSDESLYRSSVTLSMTNPKTRETTKLSPFHLPATHVHLADQQTALEARHFAAAYALFRIASMKNIHMTLPPQYRDLWKGDFAQLKKEDSDAGRGWKYDADPFAAEAKRHEIQADIQKRKEAKEKAEAAITLGLTLPGGRPNKAWERAPKVEMGLKIRTEIENLVKSESVWNPFGIKMSPSDQKNIMEDLHNSFRKSHIEEAMQYCKDREEVLAWLLIHVPEDDLPTWAFPPGYSAGISLASGDLAKEAKLKRLALAGYSSEDCGRALQKNAGDETAAAQALQDALAAPLLPTGDADIPHETLWAEEMSTLQAILDTRFSLTEPTTCKISANTTSHLSIVLHFRRPTKGYPTSAVPIISLEAKNLPAYVRLSATREAILHAQKSYLGDMMIFNVVEWFEINLSGIIDNPGSLLALQASGKRFDVSSAKAQNEQPILAYRKKPIRNHAQASTNDRDLLDQWNTRQSTAAQIKMTDSRQRLPAWKKQKEIVDVVNQYQVVIISGETGSGKSTQSVQFILDDLISRLMGSSANILCTQPRRISALGLSDRVSQERCAKEGDEVGYIIRGDSKVSSKTKITFMTTGVLLRRLQSSRSIVESLANITHIFVDEVHERSLDTDFLLALLRDGLQLRPHLRVVLMSATLDAGIFQEYFGGSKNVGLVHIEGRTFPVDDFYLDDVLRLSQTKASAYEEDDDGNETYDRTIGKAIRELGMGINYDMIADLVRHIDSDLGAARGAILIFLPGTLEIDRCLRAIERLPGIYGLPLHASLLPSEQRRVFPPAPPGRRKVIAATNVAETSITIEDVVAVIDTGRVKETNYDISNNIVRLQEVWASQAACKQRRGRAGRVQAGNCFKLFTRNVESSMAPRPEPEIRRVPLEQLCLSVKATGTDRDIADFLRRTLTPPESGAVANAIQMLHRMGALDNDRLTGLGTYLSMIPADLRCAKLLVYGCIFECLEACLTIAAILAVKSPFVSPRDKRDEAKEARLSFPSAHGDLLLDLAAFEEWSTTVSQGGMRYREMQHWCGERFLSQQTLRDVSSTRSQLLDSLKDAGLVSLEDKTDLTTGLDTQNGNHLLLRALIASALYPQLARIEFPDKKYIASMSGAKELDPEAKTIKYFNEENGRVFVHPSSVLFEAQAYSNSAHYITYFNKMATSKTFVRDLTPLSAYGLLLFGGPIELDTSGAGIMVDGWLRLRGWARIGVLVSRLRALLDDVLRKRIDSPGSSFGHERLLGIVRRLVELNGQDQ